MAGHAGGRLSCRETQENGVPAPQRTMRRSDPTIPEDRAKAIWRRAARLQAEAERRMEERAREIAAGEDADVPDPEDGFPALDVEAAAVEAGIAPEYVRIALAEVGAAGPPTAPMKEWEERAATRFLGTPERSLELVRIVAAPAERAVEAALRVLPAHPCLLQVRDVLDLGSAPGRVVVFDVPRYDWSATANPAFVEHAAMLGLRRVNLAVRSLPGARPSCEVVVSGDLEHGIRRSWRFGAGTSLAMGAAGAGAGSALAGSLALSGALLALPAVAGIALAAGLTAAVWGPTYRYYRRRVVEALEEGLRALEASARAGSGREEPLRVLAPPEAG